MGKKADCIECLKKRGLKITKHRTSIINILEQNDKPLTAEEVYNKLKEKNISINLSTVYRILEVLTDNKLAIKLSISGDSRMLFEYNRCVHRHYLICIGCKKIVAFNKCPLNCYEKALEKEMNFKIAGHKLDIYGYCSECMDKS